MSPLAGVEGSRFHGENAVAQLKLVDRRVLREIELGFHGENAVAQLK